MERGKRSGEKEREETQSSEAKRRHSRRKEDFHRFPIIPLIGCPIKFRGIVSIPPPFPPPPNSSGRVRINSRLAISSTTVSLSLPLFFFDCSLVHHANSLPPRFYPSRAEASSFSLLSSRERLRMGGEKKKEKESKVTR